MASALTHDHPPPVTTWICPTSQPVTQPHRDFQVGPGQSLAEDSSGGAAPGSLVDLDALVEAEAKLALLHPGSRNHALMAELVARLRFSADQCFRQPIRRVALRDAAALSACRGSRYRSACDGTIEPQYRSFLGAYISVLGGSLEDGPDGLVAVFSGHRITMQFGPASREATDTEATYRRGMEGALRAAFVEGAEARSRSDFGRGLTGDELQWVLGRYAADLEPSRPVP